MRRFWFPSEFMYTAYFLLIAGFVALSVNATSADAAEQTFPYKARISTDDVYVRSGPGRNYYPTDKLRAGQEVEVFRHDPGGWYAIRPPKGSFTWVSSRLVKHGRDGLAEISGDRVAARVGSRFSDIRDVIQIRLHEGEVVEPLSSSILKASQTVSQTSPKWTKIAPPSGEFRWVHGKFIDRNYATSGIRKAPAGNSPLIQQPEHEARRNQQSQETQTVAARKVTLPAISSEDFQKRLDDVDLELSVMVAEEPTVWQFDELALEAESLLNRAETALERGRARIMLSKINRYTNIKQRHNAVNTIWADTQKQNHQLADLRNQHETNRPRLSEENPSIEGRFDGQGRLMRIVSPKPGAPRYALVNESGGIQCYVTPAPGVNLRHYEQRLITVNGPRGYVPEKRAQHIMAKHVNLVDGSQDNATATKIR